MYPLDDYPGCLPFGFIAGSILCASAKYTAVAGLSWVRLIRVDRRSSRIKPGKGFSPRTDNDVHLYYTPNPY